MRRSTRAQQRDMEEPDEGEAARYEVDNMDLDGSIQSASQESEVDHLQLPPASDAEALQDVEIEVDVDGRRVTVNGSTIHFRQESQPCEVGDRALPVHWYSITVTKSGADIETFKLYGFRNFIIEFGEACVCALERGGRQGQLHIQAMALLHCATTSVRARIS